MPAGLGDSESPQNSGVLQKGRDWGALHSPAADLTEDSSVYGTELLPPARQRVGFPV